MQGGNLGQAISNATRLVLGPQAGSSGVFFSTRNRAGAVTDTALWFALDGSNFSGVADGNGFTLSFGVQASFSPEFIGGLALSYNETELDTAAGNFEVEGTVIGPYFSYSPGAYKLDGYLLYGNTDYTLNGATGDGDRLLYGLTASAAFVRETVTISPYLSLTGYSEDIGAIGAAAASDVDQTTLGLGARFDFTGMQGVNPYLLVGVDAWRFDDGTTTNDDVTARLGAGLSMDLGAGQFSLDLTASEVADDLDAVTFGLRYDMRF